jgi:branched-chain amino acid transport system substrate-binding protein
LPINNSSTSTGAWLNDGNLQGALLSGADANPYDTSIPAIASFRHAIDKYAPQLNSNPQYVDDLSTWAAGKLFQAAAKAANIGPNSTGADVKKGLYALKNETLGGLAPPLTYTPGKPAFVPCYFTVRLAGGKFASLNSNKPTCLTVAQATALAKALHL